MAFRLISQTAIAELDRRYWAFVETLPPAQAQLAGDQSIIAGAGAPTPLRSVNDGFGVAIDVPWAFCDLFPGVAEETLLDLSEAWHLLLLAILLRDHLADQQIPVTPVATELQQRAMALVREILHSFIGEQPFFWRRFEQYEQEIMTALQLEANYRARLGQNYDLNMAWRIGAGKSAFVKVIPCALTVLTETTSYLERLEASIEALMAGRQLLDDVGDWKEDVTRGHYTYPLAQAASLLVNSTTPISPQAIEAVIFNSTILENTLKQAKAWHHQATTILNGLPCQGWIDLVEYSLSHCISYHGELIIYRLVEAGKKQIPQTS